MTQPHIQVGIMADNRIIIVFDGIYNCNGKQVEGEQLFARTPNGIAWQGSTYDTLQFTPEQEEKASFLLQNVTIGIGFHWQRHENQRFRGGVELITEDKKIRVINNVKAEEYLRSVISSEMKATSSVELLKAHAVISRSWLLAQIEKRNNIEATATVYQSETNTEEERIKWYDREEHDNYDVCADDHCQRYQGITRASTQAVNEAVEATCTETGLTEGKKCSVCDEILEAQKTVEAKGHDYYLLKDGEFIQHIAHNTPQAQSIEDMLNDSPKIDGISFTIRGASVWKETQDSAQEFIHRPEWFVLSNETVQLSLYLFSLVSLAFVYVFYWKRT